jgi:very-short-patch-repair endonuclease
MSADKAAVFVAAWDLLAPPNLRTIQARHKASGGELRFAEEAIGRRWRFDWALPSVKVSVEVDGGKQMVRWSEKQRRYVVVGSHNQEDDLVRQNAAVSLGWAVLRFTPDMLRRDPAGCVEIVARVVAGRIAEN